MTETQVSVFRCQESRFLRSDNIYLKPETRNQYPNVGYCYTNEESIYYETYNYKINSLPRIRGNFPITMNEK